MATPSVRVTAAKVLARVMAGESLATALPAEEDALPAREHSLLRQLCYTTLRHWFSLNALLDQLMSKPLKGRDADIRALMLVGICQLRHTRIPAHAAISESVGATKGLKKSWARGLVNGVLRSYQRDEEKLLAGIFQSDHQYDLPEWLIGKLRKSWPEQFKAIVAGTNSQAPMSLRVNTQRVSRSAYLKQLNAAGIKAQRCLFAADGLQLEEAAAVDKLPGFFDGLVSVQDEAAQLAAALMECQPGENILDACAAPGGKTCHMLEKAENLTVTAVDLESARLERVAENLKRLSLEATLIQGDASQPQTWHNGEQFDRILLDAPCSATGVIRRHPDIKILRRADDITQLAQLQGRILDALWARLKPGGTLVYATCSILPQENSKQVEAFLARTENAVQDTPIMECGVDTGFGLQLFPQEDGHDGFFYCRLRKSQ